MSAKIETTNAARSRGRRIEDGAGWPRGYPIMPLAARIPEARRLSGIGRSKLYELIKTHKISIIKVGTITLVPVESLKAYLGS